jgi:hypothetical protein
MEQIKEAFNKVKQDIDSLKKEVSTLSRELIETRESLIEICEVLKNLSKKIEEEKKGSREEKTKDTPSASLFAPPTNISPSSKNYYTINLPSFQIPTDSFNNSTDKQHSNTSSTPHNPQEAQNYSFSMGNEGVPTDRQTDQQTDRHIDKSSYNQDFSSSESINSSPAEVRENSITNAVKILDSLDSLKKEIRLKFKRLTDQEFLVFSTIYQVSEEKGYTDYKNLSEQLNLTESSIRDYIGRLIKKGIPVDKVKINNKTIHLSVSQDLKKIASLPALMQLRSI